MRLTSTIRKAINKAAVLHLGQKRKADGLPFIVHPYSVAFILAGYTNDENIIVAGLLHDVLEDVKGYTLNDIKKDFGKEVMQIVKDVSEEKDPNDSKEKSKSTWQARKKKYLTALKDGSREAMMVSCADKIHNLKSMIDSYKRQGEKLWSRFNASPTEELWFYGEALGILKKDLENSVVEELEHVYLEAKNLFEEDEK